MNWPSCGEKGVWGGRSAHQAKWRQDVEDRRASSVSDLSGTTAGRRASRRMDGAQSIETVAEAT